MIRTPTVILRTRNLWRIPISSPRSSSRPRSRVLLLTGFRVWRCGFSPHGSLGNRRSAHSRGVGSDNVFSEEDVYKRKDLSLIKVDALPKDAAQFRSWKNAFVTRVCAIDRTGADTLLRWLLPAFETAGDANLPDGIAVGRSQTLA